MVGATIVEKVRRRDHISNLPMLYSFRHYFFI
jgi:hypothetical protein